MPRKNHLRSQKPFRVSHHLWLGACGLSTALLLSPALAQTSIDQTASAMGQQQHHFDIPVQGLSMALTSFALQSGLQISVDSQLLTGLLSSSLNGTHSNNEALSMLLKDTGLAWRYSDDGTLLIEAGPDYRSQPDDSIRLGEILVPGSREGINYQGRTTIDRTAIEAMPAGNGDITSLLRSHPSVQFDNSQQSSKTPGEISPAEISINGAKFYQNAFLIDGLNMNSDIDPAQEGTPYRLFAAPGASQGLALDTDLLDEITVLDSNVSAAYGRFNGGVVEATTRNPSRELRGRVSAQMTRSSWTNYHIHESEETDFENASSWGDGHPEFEKITLRTTLEGHLTENVGLLANFTSKRSEIPSMFYQSHLVDTMGDERQNQKRRIDNYFLKGVWKASDRLNLESSLTYAPEENRYFRSGIRNSGIDITRGGMQFNLKAKWQADWGRVEHSFGWNRLDLSRNPDYDDYMTWSRSESKPWGSNNNTLEGEFGDIEQQQSGYQYRMDTTWNPFRLLGTTHRLKAGIELSEQNVFYERLSESSTYVKSAQTDTCTNSAGVTDTLTCSMGTTIKDGWAGQYLTSRTRYATGSFEFNTTSWAMYLEDEIEVGHLNIRPGIRVDDDSYMDKTTFSPRLALAYDLFGDRSTLLQAGANRYYGRNIASWRLQEGRNQLRYNGERRDSLDSGWTIGTQATNQVKFNQLDIAYDDELMLGISQKWQGFEFGFKYVNRKGRDQVIQVSGRALDEPSTDPTLANNYTTYTNDGKSETDIFSLTITPLRNFTLLGTISSGQLALDWTDSKSSSPSYFDHDDSYYRNEYIQYEGSVIRYSERPADNYTRPWTARLTTTTQIPQLNLNWTNFLRYRAAYSKIGNTGRAVEHNGLLIDVWEERSFRNALTWDLRLGYELPIARNQALFVNVDVFNVLDQKSVSDSTSVNSTGIPTYEVGRQYWLEVGYRF